MNAAVFASPSDPVFNIKGVCMSPELLEDYLYVLAEENRERLIAALPDEQTGEGLFNQGEFANMVFSTCKDFQQPPEVRFLAVELFDLFMQKQIGKLYNSLQSSHQLKKEEKINRTDQIVQAYTILQWVVTCIQVASKVCFHGKILSLRTCKDFLMEKTGQNCGESVLLKAELNLLKTLNYQVSLLTPQVFFETILEVFAHNYNSTSQVKAIHTASLSILDLFYISKDTIYFKLSQRANRGDHTPVNRRKLVSIKRDYLLMSVGIISSAAFICDHSSSDRVNAQLQKITCIHKTDIVELASIILETVFIL